MPYNGSGTFNRLYSWVVDAANSINISSTRTDAEMNGFAAGLTNCITRDGQSPPSADLPMGGKKLTNLGNATVSTDALNMGTADSRYILSSGAISLSGTLTVAGLITASANLAVTGTVTATSTYTSSGAGFISNGFLNVSGTQPVGYSHNRSGQVGYHLYNQGAVSEWIVYQPAHATDDNFHIGSLMGGTITDRLAISTAGAVTIPGTLGVTGAVTLTVPLAVTSGGTGVTSSTGTGSLVLSASPALTGSPTAPTQSANDNSTKIATTAYVNVARSPLGQTITSNATATPTFSDDFVEITAQAAALNFANPTGTPVNMWGWVLRIKDNGGAQAITYGTQYRGVGVTLPTTTVAGKTLILGGIWNNALSKVDVVSVAQE